MSAFGDWSLSKEAARKAYSGLIMKILHVIPSTDLSNGGPIEAIRQSAATTKKMGHANEIACLDPPDSLWLDDIGLPIHALGPAVGGKYRYSGSFARWLRRHVSQFDCVIVHGIWSFVDVATRHALRRSGIPYFIYAHGMLDPTFRRLYPWKHIKKSLYWLLIERRVLRDARAVFFTCAEERDLARKSFWPCNWHPAVVPYCVNGPPNALEDQAEHFLGKHPELANKRLILFLSRIHPKKGCDHLIDSFASVAHADPATHLVMAGPGELPKWLIGLQQRSRELGIAHRITWTGMLKGHDKWSALRAAEVFVLPSHQENFGIAVTEALSCGTPVLITNRVNIWPDIASDGAGLVAAPGAAGTLELLESWFALDMAKREAMRTRAVDCFARRFDSHSAARVLVETLMEHGVSESSQNTFESVIPDVPDTPSRTPYCNSTRTM
jgi:glycosyltransferase involved in cell wall biosynthesis